MDATTFKPSIDQIHLALRENRANLEKAKILYDTCVKEFREVEMAIQAACEHSELCTDFCRQCGRCSSCMVFDKHHIPVAQSEFI
jgi:hypothetical protein